VTGPAAHPGSAQPSAPSPRPTSGPVQPSPTAQVALRPIPLSGSRIVGGFWAQRQRTNREVSVPVGSSRLREAGNLSDLELAAQQLADPDTPVDPAAYKGPWFMDSDVYKWLEAVAWEIAREPSTDLLAEIETFSKAIASAQAEDGYVNSYVQVKRGGQDRYADLAMGHELYCFGHLIQAGVAAHRAVGEGTLWDIARRAADHLVDTFGPNGNPGLDGHPVVEMALVELYRESGDRRYLDLAEHFVNTRGHGTIRGRGREPIYYSDRVPVRDAKVPEGHAVRAVYLAAGASDVAVEGRDPDRTLDAALERQWRAMRDTKQYITGGLGSRWDGEAFGDPYELPPDVAYAETCATIGAVQWAWRRLLATGDVAYADSIEHMLFNGFISGISLSGNEFFYVNALQVRADAVPDDHRQPVNGRQQWFQTACCPPNIMRTLAQLGGYLATTTDDGIQLQQYAAATVSDGGRSLSVRTDYPWDGRIEVTVTASDDAPWTLSLRVPEWSTDARLSDPDGATSVVQPGYATISRRWRAGDTVVLELPMPVRLSAAAPRVDAVRGCRAIERGPLVYAVEQIDQPAGLAVDDLHLVDADPSRLDAQARPDLLGGCVVVRGPAIGADGATGEFTAIPYCLWSNRETGPMRVWIPIAERTEAVA
jgi:uncharacterized protein